MHDPTESIRRELVGQIDANPGSREALEAKHGKVWSTDELTADFVVLSFCAPFVLVRRKTDNKRGMLEFQHSPRFYYSFEESR